MRRRYKMLMLAAAITAVTVGVTAFLVEYAEQLSVAPALRGDAERNPELNSGAEKEVVPVAESNAETEPWRKAYAEILRGSEAKKFSFCYVDDDEVPELVLHMSDEFVHSNNAVWVYTFREDAAVCLGEELCCDGYSTFLYVPRTGCIISGFYHNGYGAYRVLSLENGELKALHYFDEDAEGSGLYHIDDQSFPAWEYRRRFYRYAKGNVNDYGDYENTEENIRITLDA